MPCPGRRVQLCLIQRSSAPQVRNSPADQKLIPVPFDCNPKHKIYIVFIYIYIYIYTHIYMSNWYKRGS